MSSCRTRTPQKRKKSGQCPPPRKQLNSLEEIVGHYIENYRPEAECELAFYRNQPNLENAIRVSALALTREGKKHDHQWRIPPELLEQLRRGLTRNAKSLQSCKDFTELMAITTKVAGEIWRDATLTIYDTAHRLGAFLEKEPDRVYLHAGTKEGARALGISSGGSVLTREDFPKVFEKLKPYEIENFLCIYRDNLRAFRINGKGSS